MTRRNTRADLAALSNIIQQHAITKLLIGDPIRMTGEQGRQSAWVRSFAETAAKHLGLPVEFWDERLTSREAERVLRGSGVAPEDRKAAIDRLSAVILLQSYLDALHLRSAEHAR